MHTDHYFDYDRHVEPEATENRETVHVDELPNMGLECPYCRSTNTARYGPIEEYGRTEFNYFCQNCANDFLAIIKDESKPFGRYEPLTHPLDWMDEKQF